LIIDITHQSNISNVLLYGYDDGTDRSIHSKQSFKPVAIDEDKQCGLGKSYMLVKDFRKISIHYYQYVNQNRKRFPPSYYLPEGATKRLGEMFENIPTSSSSRILTGYNPIEHLKVLGFEDKDFDKSCINKESTFENTVTVLVPDRSLIVFNMVVDRNDAEEVKTEIMKCNDLIKALYAANQKNLSNQYVAVVGTIVLQSIPKDQFQTTFPFLNLVNNESRQDNEIMFLTKEQVESTNNLQEWWDTNCVQIQENIRSIKPPQVTSQPHEAIEAVTGEMMATMSIISSKLPKMTYDTAEMISNLLLNFQQINVILDTTPWKVISGHYGSGKSVCLQEIARRLYQKNDGSKIFYICFDPYSLLDIHIGNHFKTKFPDNERLKSISLSGFCSGAGYSVEDFYNRWGSPKKNVADIFKHLRENIIGPCHMLVDEFPEENISQTYCNQLKDCLQRYFEDSTVVIATQCMKSVNQVTNKGNLETNEQFKLENAGMTPLTLVKAMRIPSNLFEIEGIAIDTFHDNETLLPLSNIQNNDQSSPLSNDLKDGQSSPLLLVQAESNESIDTNKLLSNSTIENKTNEPIDTHMLGDPQMFVKRYPDALPSNIEDATRIIKSKQVFVEGECGTISSPKKPKLIYLPNEFSIEDFKYCTMLKKVLEEQVLRESQKISFICNDDKEIIAIKYALELLGHSNITYAPYILENLPSFEEKCAVVEKLNAYLITDYRSIRGCEDSHVVFFIDPNQTWACYVLIEMLTRATSRLDMLVYPSLKSNDEVPTCLKNILLEWEKTDDIDQIKVEMEPRKRKLTVSINNFPYHINIKKTDEKKFDDNRKWVETKRNDIDKKKAFR